MESKITLFNQMLQKETQVIQKEIRENRYNTIHKIVEIICVTAIFTSFIGLAAWAIAEDIKNPRPPRPIVYIQRPQPWPGITLTLKRPWDHLDNSWRFPWEI